MRPNNVNCVKNLKIQIDKETVGNWACTASARWRLRAYDGEEVLRLVFASNAHLRPLCGFIQPFVIAHYIREELLQPSSFYTCRLWYQPRPLSRGEGYTTETVAANVARNGTITRQDGHVVITRHSFNYADNGLHTMQWLCKASKRLLMALLRLCSGLSGQFMQFLKQSKWAKILTDISYQIEC